MRESSLTFIMRTILRLRFSVDDVNDSPESIELSAGDNVKEGMMSFVERRAPIWTNPKGKL
jgi:hypothetical protein